MTVTQITTHETDAQGRLVTLYADATKLRALIGIVGARAQSVEDVAWALLTERSIATAVGAQLDQLGGVLGVDRGTSTDEQIRIKLYAAIATYRSDGTPETVIGVFKLLTQATTVQMQEVFPANVILTAIAAPYPIGTRTEIREAAEGLKAAGVSLESVIISGTTPFVFAGDPDPAGAGFGDTLDANAGGNFADVI